MVAELCSPTIHWHSEKKRDRLFSTRLNVTERQIIESWLCHCVPTWLCHHLCSRRRVFAILFWSYFRKFDFDAWLESVPLPLCHNTHTHARAHTHTLYCPFATPKIAQTYRWTPELDSRSVKGLWSTGWPKRRALPNYHEIAMQTRWWGSVNVKFSAK